MPGNSAQEAREAFLEPLRRSLSCFTTAQLYVPHKPAGELEAVTTSEDPVVLRSAGLGRVGFQFGHQFRVVNDDEGWHVSTIGYLYQIYGEDDSELIAWHWHPGTFTRPHLHVPAGPLHKRMHVPTGRVSVESVLRFLLTELRVGILRADLEVHRILDEAETHFIEHRRWHG